MDIIHVSFPAALSPFLPDFLAASIHHLQALYPPFERYYISSSDSVPQTSEDETVELTQLICPVLDFLASVVRGGKARSWFVNDHLAAVIVSVFKLAQMTDEDVSRLLP